MPILRFLIMREMLENIVTFQNRPMSDPVLYSLVYNQRQLLTHANKVLPQGVEKLNQRALFYAQPEVIFVLWLINTHESSLLAACLKPTGSWMGGPPRVNLQAEDNVACAGGIKADVESKARPQQGSDGGTWRRP